MSALRVSVVLSLFLCWPFCVDAATFSVGSDAACTHSNLLAAVSAASSNGPDMDEIRVASNQAYANQILPIAGHSVTVVGGYATCASATPSGRTVIRGNSAGTIGTFSTSGTAPPGGMPFRLLLRNLELRDGGNLVGRRGGALRIEGEFDVTVSNVEISENQAGRGGGIYLDGSDDARLFLAGGTSIRNNTAGISGGGLYCVDGGFVSLTAAAIESNTALDNGSDPDESGSGGGVALYRQCSMRHSGSSGASGVRDNVAQDGGGYYLRSADLFVLGEAGAAAWVLGNDASGAGGGIAINDDFTDGISLETTSNVEIFDSRIEDNTGLYGAGIAVVVGGQVAMRRTRFGSSCHDATRCSTLSRNTATAAQGVCLGGALYAGVASAVSIQHTFIDDNCRTARGHPLRVDENARVRIDSSVLARNGDEPFGFGPRFDGLFDFSWSTMTGHLSSPRTALMRFPSDATATGRVRLFGSILGEPFERMYGVLGGGTSPMQLVADCLLLDASYTQSTAPFRITTIAAPWGMVAPGAGNYRPSATSEAVDYCDTSVLPRMGGDMEGGAVPFDQTITDLFGSHDVGAYELAGALADAVFADGFE